MCYKSKRNGVLKVLALILVLLNFAVVADWSFSSAFDFDGDGVIGLGDFAIFAFHWGQIDPELLKPDITWVSIIDPGFVGEMSVYETTNAQYAHYLNAALGTGDIKIEGSYVKGNGGIYNGQNFYRLNGPGWTGNGAVNGGESRIVYSDGVFTVKVGFDNHPVTYVSWYGATSFSTYYGWRLPSTSEWQAVADYDGSYTYGCGTTINNSIANYWDSVHPHGTTPVWNYGTFGYGLADMAGNVWEWTSTSIVSGSYRVLRSGSWYSFAGSDCAVSFWSYDDPSYMNNRIGIRVCR